MKKYRFPSVYITYRIADKNLNGPLKCEGCKKRDPVFGWDFKIDLFGPLISVKWLCKKCYKKSFKQFLKEEKQ